ATIAEELLFAKRDFRQPLPSCFAILTYRAMDSPFSHSLILADMLAPELFILPKNHTHRQQQNSHHHRSHSHQYRIQNIHLHTFSVQKYYKYLT
ncbi:MAG: hypothetical protein IKT13_04830, partial [Paludibacteraceae bacterium]|nr:hypothetical protein [Paludibacteraceae bacterium]